MIGVAELFVVYLIGDAGFRSIVLFELARVGAFLVLFGMFAETITRPPTYEPADSGASE
jgi:hypothetical protein